MPAANLKVICASPRDGGRLSLDGWGAELGETLHLPCASGGTAPIRTVAEA